MKNKYTSASIVLGIISSAFSLFAAAGVVMGILGLGLGLRGKKLKKNGKSAGVILNIAALSSTAVSAVIGIIFSIIKLIKNQHILPRNN